jgi:hypothetical protein
MRTILLAAMILPQVCVGTPLLLSSVDAGLRIGGPAPGIDWGRPIAAGDFDGDGYDDLVVAASESFGGVTSFVYVIRGRRDLAGAGYIDLSVTAADLIFEGEQTDDNLGASVAVGDVNGDDIDDLLLVASTADAFSLADRGIAYLMYGKPEFYADPVRPLVNDGTWDVKLIGPVPAGDMGGASLFGGLDAHGAAIGDVNGDEFEDIVLGVHLADGSQSDAGRAYVKFGSAFPTGSVFNLAQSNQYDVAIWGAGQLDELGTMVAVGDITDDGIGDVILGNAYASRGLFTSEGTTYIFRGRTNWPAFVNLFSAVADITIVGGRLDDRLGEMVTTGDYNGDTITDLAMAAPGAELGALSTQTGSGIVYLLLGGAHLQTGIIQLDLLMTSLDATYVGEDVENLGTGMASADVNRDGICDLIAAERFAGQSTNGVVEVLFGHDFATGTQFEAGVSSDLRIEGEPSDRIGFWVGTSNVNGDGLPEVLFSTPFNNGNAGTLYAYTYVTGNVDPDDDIDAIELAGFQLCAGDADTPQDERCSGLDFSLDGVVTGEDWVIFEQLVTGPGTE